MYNQLKTLDINCVNIDVEYVTFDDICVYMFRCLIYIKDCKHMVLVSNINLLVYNFVHP